MSTVSISYNSLSNASDEAKNVAKRLDDYADAISNSVYRKLNNYNGPRSSNISTASNHINSKISELRSQSEQYEKYATSLTNLEKECRSTDKSVRSKVSTLTATFKQNHGISNSKIQNTVSYFFTSLGNSTSFGRWLGDGKDKFDAADDYFKQKIEDWYNYEGGEDLIKGTLVGLLEVAIAVVTVVAAITTLLAGGALFAMIVAVASLIGGIIAGVNGLTNLVNEGRAYNATSNGDPATGKRRSSEDTLTDTIRTESDSKTWHNIATGIDVINFACSAVSIVSGWGDLLKNGYKWATGSIVKLEDIKMKDVLTGSTFRAFLGKLKTNGIDAFTDIKSAIKLKDWGFFKGMAKDFKTDFANNFRKKFMDFSDKKSSFNTSKNILGVGKSILKDGLDIKNITKVGFEDIAMPCIKIADIPVAQGEKAKGIYMKDIYKVYKDGSKIIKGIVSPDFVKDSPIKANVLEKLSTSANIKISIPDIHIPEINTTIPKKNAA